MENKKELGLVFEDDYQVIQSKTRNERKEMMERVVSELKSAYLKSGNRVMQNIESDQEMVNNEFKGLVKYSEKLLEKFGCGDIRVQERIKWQIEEVSDYFAKVIKSDIKKSRESEADNYYNKNTRSERQAEEIQLDDLENLQEQIEERMLNVVVRDFEENKEKSNDQRNETNELIEDKIKSELNQELRSILYRYDDLPNIDKFIDELTVYVKYEMPRSILNNLEQSSYYMDKEIENLVEYEINDVKSEVDRFVKVEQEKEETQKSQEPEKEEPTQEENQFMSSLKSKTHSDEEFVENLSTEGIFDESDKEKENDKNKDNPLAHGDYII